MKHELVLPKEIRTEYFYIEIKYSILRSGRIQAVLKVVKSPKDVTDVIYDGGSTPIDSNYKSFVVIDGMIVGNLHTKLKDIISVTTEKIEKIEKNIKTLEFNNLLSEALS